MTEPTSVRLDKWLWAARFFKTRQLAQAAVNGGKVHYNQQSCKPSKNVQIGATLTVRQGYDIKTIIVKALSDKRGNATAAQALYEETPESVEKRLLNQQQRKLNNANLAPKTKPNKQQRRHIIQFKQKQD